LTFWWNKEQAELLRWLALAGGSASASECQEEALDALIKVGFVVARDSNQVLLTDLGLARSRELRADRMPRYRRYGKA
jgi:hypothetical protein